MLPIEKPHSTDDDYVDAMLARLSSAMNIERSHTPEPSAPGGRSERSRRSDIPSEPRYERSESGERGYVASESTERGKLASEPSNASEPGDLDSNYGLLDSCLSLDRTSESAGGKTSKFSSSSTLHDEERSTLLLESSTPSKCSTTDHSRPQSRTPDSRPQSRTLGLKAQRTSRQGSLDSRKEDAARESMLQQQQNQKPPGKKKEMPWSRKRGKKSEEEKRKMEMEMWNASDSTVLEHLLSHKGHVGKWQAVAAARGLCSLSNNCRCADCQSSYVTFDNDGDGGMGAGAPLYHIVAPACSLQ